MNLSPEEIHMLDCECPNCDAVEGNICEVCQSHIANLRDEMVKEREGR